MRKNGSLSKITAKSPRDKRLQVVWLTVFEHQHALNMIKCTKYEVALRIG